MPNKCFVKFENNPAKVCYSGQTFRGTVSLTLIKNVREVYLKIIGEAYARWSKSGGDGGSKSFIGQEEYIDERIYLFTSINGNQHSLVDSIESIIYNKSCVIPEVEFVDIIFADASRFWFGACV